MSETAFDSDESDHEFNIDLPEDGEVSSDDSDWSDIAMKSPFRTRQNDLVYESDESEASSVYACSVAESVVEHRKIKSGRVVDRENTELEFMLPANLAEDLSKVSISEEERLVLCGHVIHRIADTATVTFGAAAGAPLLDLGCAVFDDERRPVGLVGYVFGRPEERCYQLLCGDEAVCERLVKGSELLCAPHGGSAVFRGAEEPEKVLGGDEGDEEAFSDDEAEMRAMGGKAGARGKPSRGKRRGDNRGGFVVQPEPRRNAGFLVPPPPVDMSRPPPPLLGQPYPRGYWQPARGRGAPPRHNQHSGSNDRH